MTVHIRSPLNGTARQTGSATRGEAYVEQPPARRTPAAPAPNSAWQSVSLRQTQLKPGDFATKIATKSASLVVTWQKLRSHRPPFLGSSSPTIGLPLGGAGGHASPVPPVRGNTSSRRLRRPRRPPRAELGLAVGIPATVTTSSGAPTVNSPQKAALPVVTVQWQLGFVPSADAFIAGRAEVQARRADAGVVGDAATGVLLPLLGGRPLADARAAARAVPLARLVDIETAVLVDDRLTGFFLFLFFFLRFLASASPNRRRPPRPIPAPASPRTRARRVGRRVRVRVTAGTRAAKA